MEQSNEPPSGKFADFVGQDSPPTSSHDKIPWKAILLTFLAVILLCIAVGGFFSLRVSLNLKREKPALTQVIDAFMQAMSERDTAKAYTLFSPRVQRQMPEEKLKEMIQGKNYSLFQGYRRVAIENFILSKSVNTNPDVPQGYIAKVNGLIHYEGEITGKFDAILEKVGGTWRLDYINVSAPPEKFP